MTTRKPNRFSSPGVIDKKTDFFGATVQVWEEAMTADIEKTLQQVKRKVDLAQAKPMRDEPASADLASAAKHYVTYSR